MGFGVVVAGARRHKARHPLHGPSGRALRRERREGKATQQRERSAARTCTRRLDASISAAKALKVGPTGTLGMSAPLYGREVSYLRSGWRRWKAKARSTPSMTVKKRLCPPSPSPSPFSLLCYCSFFFFFFFFFKGVPRRQRFVDPPAEEVGRPHKALQPVGPLRSRVGHGGDRDRSSS